LNFSRSVSLFTVAGSSGRILPEFSALVGLMTNKKFLPARLLVKTAATAESP
jgi:hypothetical protein